MEEDRQVQERYSAHTFTYPSQINASGHSRLHLGPYHESTPTPPTFKARLRSATYGALGGLFAGYMIPGLGSQDLPIGLVAGFASGYLLPNRQALQFPVSFVIALGLNMVFVGMTLMLRALNR